MKEIKLLRKMQRYLDNMKYPGYPFSMNAIVDMSKGYENASVVDNYGRKKLLKNYLKDFSYSCLYESLGCYKATKGSWLYETEMQNHKEYVDITKIEDNDFYIDNTLMARLYFAFMSALREAKQNKTIKVIWLMCDTDCEYVDCETFRNEREISEYFKTYYCDME